MCSRVIFGLFLLFIAPLIKAQDIEVRGYFLEDSIKIGYQSPYVLTAKYPRKLDVVFPDSLYDYSPYELGEKWFAPTRSTEDTSLDSAIYYIISFEIDSSQTFSLPVFQLIGQDSIKIETALDTIFLQHMVTEIPDSVTAETLPLIENTNYRVVDFALNYPYLVAGLGIVLLLLILTYIIFGKKIKKWFVLRKMNKEYEAYKEAFSKLNARGDEGVAADIIALWKKYHEKLERVPYTTMTTKELMSFDHIKTLESHLKAIDRSIYGGIKLVKDEDIEMLKKYSENKYLDKVNEVKYG